MSGSVQTFADKLFNQAVDLENDLLEHAKDGTFTGLYSDGKGGRTPNNTAAGGGGGGGGGGLKKRRSHAQSGGAIGLLLVRACIVYHCLKRPFYVIDGVRAPPVAATSRVKGPATRRHVCQVALTVSLPSCIECSPSFLFIVLRRRAYVCMQC